MKTSRQHRTSYFKHIKMKILKSVTTSLLLGASFLFIKCGGNNPSGPASPVQSVPEAPQIDLNAKSTSKGVGKFTSVEMGKLDVGMAEKGEAIFLSRCAVCHKSSDEKLVGPGLKGVTERREPEWIMNMIVNAEEMERKDEIGKALKKEYSLAMPNQSLTDEETRQVLEYLRKNDQ